MFWVAIIAIVWITLALLVLAICRAAAAGDAAQRREARSLGRFARPATRVRVEPTARAPVR